MKELRYLTIALMVIGLFQGCSQEDIPDPALPGQVMTSKQLKFSSEPVFFEGIGSVTLVEYAPGADQTVFTYSIEATSGSVDQLDMGIELCRVSPQIISFSGASADYGADPRLKKYPEYKSVGWLKLKFTTDIQTEQLVTLVIQGFWNAEPRTSVLLGSNGFAESMLTVPVCKEVTLATVESISMDVTESAIELTGIVLDEGASEVYNRGFIWSFSQVPDLDHFDGIIQVGSGMGEYSASIDPLGSNPKIFVRAYAYNYCSTCYSETAITFGSVLIYPDTPVENGSFTDDRDGKQYKTVQIGDQVWMAENLAFIPEDAGFIRQISKKKLVFSGVYVYDYMGTSVEEAKTTENYQKYGCLYDWDHANGLCPEGWHLPSDAEWKILESALGLPPDQLDKYSLTERSGGDVGSHLKSTSSEDWFWEVVSDVLVGDNSSGFNAKAAGHLYPSNYEWNRFNWLGQDAIFWTSSMEGADYIARDLKYASTGVARWLIDKDRGFSVRCIKN